MNHREQIEIKIWGEEIYSPNSLLQKKILDFSIYFPS